MIQFSKEKVLLHRLLIAETGSAAKYEELPGWVRKYRMWLSRRDDPRLQSKKKNRQRREARQRFVVHPT
ncbi:MAG: hypothetical protein ACI4PG_11485, partial [Candidatus Ventricola sp.]